MEQSKLPDFENRQAIRGVPCDFGQPHRIIDTNTGGQSLGGDDFYRCLQQTFDAVAVIQNRDGAILDVSHT